MALAVLTFAACGGEESGCAEPVDVAGVWDTTSTVVSDNCDGRMSQTFPMTITQDGNALTAEIPELTFSGTICGNQIQMKGSFPDEDGTVTVNATLNVSAEGDSMQGSDNWTWTDGSESCSGSDSLSAISYRAPIYDACHNVEDCVQSADLCEELSVDFAGFTYVNAICTLTCETEGPLSPDCPRAWVGLLGSCYPSSVAGGIVDAAICFEPCYVDADCQVGFRCFGATDLCGADFTSCPIDENDAICVPGPS
jgi:hypothetical protein